MENEPELEEFEDLGLLLVMLGQEEEVKGCLLDIKASSMASTTCFHWIIRQLSCYNFLMYYIFFPLLPFISRA